MAIVNHSFKTKSEAEAFKQGIEYVNDSAVKVIDIRRDKDAGERPWIAVCEDEDM